MRGGAQSHLLEADDRQFYIVKFQNNPQHRRILVNELVASVLLNYLQISAPDCAMLSVPEEFLRANPDISLTLGSHRIPVRPGWHFGSRYPVEPRLRAFPTPEQILAAGEQRLRDRAGLGYRAPYLIALADQVVSGALDLHALQHLDDEAAIETITQVKGLGRWSAEMFLMFRLHRPDVMPVDDLGIVKAMMKAYGLRKKPKPKRMLQIADAWRPYRSVACWYLWRSLENA
jgi:hypothetical protein